MSAFTASFAAAAARAKPPQWRRESYEAYLRKASDVVRVTEDRKLLRAVLRRARKSPTAQSALAWAKAHDIKIIVDRTTNAGGYYQRETGVVALALPVLQGEYKSRMGIYYDIEVLVHEIRHAWQDHHGLLPQQLDYRRASLARTTIQQALYEADANAHGRLAALECEPPSEKIHSRTWRGNEGLPHLDWDEPQRFLRTAFRQWYAGARASSYPAHQAKYQAAALKLTTRDAQPVKAPDYQTEMRAVKAHAAVAGLDPWRREDIEKLGRSFAGVNYLAGWHDAALWTRILSPAMAARHFSDIKQPDPLAGAVRKAQLLSRFNLHHRRPILTLRPAATPKAVR